MQAFREVGMTEHGDYDFQKLKWYCGYWMNEEEWLEIHDYVPPTLQQKDIKEPIEEDNDEEE
jgi:hypothetical protein